MAAAEPLHKSTALLVEADEDELATFQKKKGPLHDSRLLLSDIISKVEHHLTPSAHGHEGAKPQHQQHSTAQQPTTPAASKGKQAKKEKGSEAAAAAGGGDIGLADLAVARLSGVKRHTERLLTATVELGASQAARPLVTGLAEHYTPEQLEGRTVVVVLNLKPAKLQGAESAAMLLAADAPREAPPVRLVAPPPAAQPGDRVQAHGHTPAAGQLPVLDRAGWGAIAASLHVQGGLATFAGQPLEAVGRGPCSCPAPDGAPIH